MRLIFGIACTWLVISQVVCEKKSDWAWGEDGSDQFTKQLDVIEEIAPSESEFYEQQTALNETEVEQVVDTILTSTRQGRNLEGFDEVYSDPSLQDALQKGDDSEARNIIKDRLCNLGLMNCGIEGKRPYISPEELIYAQPVAINPVGRPIPTIPVKGPIKAYGPPKPMPPPIRGSKYPPGKYGPPPSITGPRPGFPPKPHYPGPINQRPPLNGGPSGFDKPLFNPIPNRPPPPPFQRPFPEQPSLNYDQGGPYEFDRGFINDYQTTSLKDKKVDLLVGGANNGGVQQHVHHHFHHGGDAKVPVSSANNLLTGASTVGSAVVATNGFTQTSNLNSYGGQTLANYGSNSNQFTGLGSFGVKPIVENQGPQTFGSQSLYQTNSFGASVGSYGNTGLYKKEFEINGNSIQNNYLQSSYASGNKYQDLPAPRGENYDCVCVPYDQCPNHEVIGRKEDLYLALDPRNLKSDIEAEEERVITDGNGTMTTIRVAKDASLNATIVEEAKKEESKKISKREAPVDKDLKKGDEKAEARQNNNYNNNNYYNKIKPTFGVSFGLPHQGGGGYPINPFGPSPLVNPYGHHLGGHSGINLGLVSVNPLVSLQVSKDDYGEKVIKPFVNLHVTPNDFLLHKFHDFFAYKKGLLHNKHHHYHHFKPHYPHFKPHFHGPPGPPIFEGPYREGPEVEYAGPPHYAPHYDHEGPIFDKPHFPKPHFNHYEDPTSYGDGGFFGRSYNESKVVKGNHLFNQYQQQHNKIPNSYGYGQYFYGNQQINQGNIAGANQGQTNIFPSPNAYNPSYYTNQDQQNNNQGNIPGANQGQANIFPSPNAYNPSYYTNQDQAQKVNFQNNNDYQDYDQNEYQNQNTNQYNDYDQNFSNSRGGKSLTFSSHPNQSQNPVKFPTSRRRRDVTSISDHSDSVSESQSNNEARVGKRQAFYQPGRPQVCGPRHVCCKRPLRPNVPSIGQHHHQCGTRHSQGINGRIKNPVYVDGDSEFGEYPWQVAILKKDPKESVYACGGTLIDALHIITAAHCIKTYTNYDLRVRLGEWDVNHDVEFYPYIERDISSVNVHPEFYAGTLYNDIAILRMDKPVDFTKHPHISPACLPSLADDYTGTRCWTTGWGKDAFGDFGKYQNILKEVDVPIVGHAQCQQQLRQTRLGYDFKLHPGFVCAGGEEGKDACKGDGGGPMVCERGGSWQVVGVVSWGIGCGQYGVPGVYVKVAHYLDWIRQIVQRF